MTDIRLPDLAERLFEVVAGQLPNDGETDEFGFDPEWTKQVVLPALRPLYRNWFRVEVSGIDNVPKEGAALLVANHSGAIAVDAVMLQVAVHDEHPARRHLRLLGADFLFSWPVARQILGRSGVTVAQPQAAEQLLLGGEVVGVFPEGVKGTGKPVWERYRLQRFGRGGFAAAAMRTGTPIVPVSIVGAEETYPIIADIPPLAKLLGVPYFPVTPTFPLLGPLGLIPLPSKWLIEFGEPIDTREYAQSTEDTRSIFNLADQVKDTIQQTLYRLVERRGGAFGGKGR